MSSDEEDIDSIEEEEEVVVKPKRRRKKKKNKDPNRPKRNMSAFFLYSNAHRQRVKEENPDAKFGDIVSSLPLSILCLLCMAHIMCLLLYDGSGSSVGAPAAVYEGALLFC